jgi:hypothetical protein
MIPLETNLCYFLMLGETLLIYVIIIVITALKFMKNIIFMK